jgi:hypothetical protein
MIESLCCNGFFVLLLQPFVTTDEIDKAVHQMVIEFGAYPSPLGYGGFPKSVCTSVNECMFHGIPDSRPLQVWSSMRILFCSIYVTPRFQEYGGACGEVYNISLINNFLYSEWRYYKHRCCGLLGWVSWRYVKDFLMWRRQWKP